MSFRASPLRRGIRQLISAHLPPDRLRHRRVLLCRLVVNQRSANRHNRARAQFFNRDRVSLNLRRINRPGTNTTSIHIPGRNLCRIKIGNLRIRNLTVADHGGADKPIRNHHLVTGERTRRDLVGCYRISCERLRRDLVRCNITRHNRIRRDLLRRQRMRHNPIRMQRVCLNPVPINSSSNHMLGFHSPISDQG